MILRDYLPYLPIFNYVTIEGTKGTMQGYKPSAFVVSNNWNTWEWMARRGNASLHGPAERERVRPDPSPGMR